MAPRHALVLVNPAARRGEDASHAVAPALAARGITCDVESIGETATLAARIARRVERAQCIVVAGGDGTISRCIPAVLASGRPLGILPFGTANNLARTLGIAADLEVACDVIAAARLHRVDVGDVNGHPFLTTASIGLSVDITEALTPEAKKRWGPFAYATAAARTVLRARRFAADITWDDGRRASRTVQVVVGNGRFYGNAMQVAEDATIDDQALDLYTLEVRHWWQLLALGPALRRGTHGKAALVHALRARAFTVRTRRPMTINADGELLSRTPATFTLRPAALPIYAPPPSQAPGLR